MNFLKLYFENDNRVTCVPIKDAELFVQEFGTQLVPMRVQASGRASLQDGMAAYRAPRLFVVELASSWKSRGGYNSSTYILDADLNRLRESKSLALDEMIGSHY